MTSKTATRRPAARRPARRRGKKAPYRWIIFGPALAAGPLAWQGLGRPDGSAGFLVLAALSLLLLPVLMLAVVTTPVSLLKTAVPRRWRAARNHGRPHPRPKALLVRVVHAADRDRCVGCGVHQSRLAPAHLISFPGLPKPKRSLQLDHFFPFALGGGLILWNLFLLCPRCNVIKSYYWEDRGTGRVSRPRGWSAEHEREAARIARRERLARLNPARWLRAAWAL